MSVYQALVERLRTVSGLPRLQLTNDVVTTFKANESYVRPTLLQAESSGRTKGVNGYVMQKGLLRIDLFVPMGSSSPDELAQTIRQVFPERGSNSKIAVGTTSLTLLNAWVETGRDDDPHYVTPIFVRWQMPER